MKNLSDKEITIELKKLLAKHHVLDRHAAHLKEWLFSWELPSTAGFDCQFIDA